MLKTINVCDRCEAECKWDSISVVTGTQEDPGAGKSVDAWESVDLCENCSRSVLLKMVRDMTPEQAAAWIQDAKTKPKPVRV